MSDTAQDIKGLDALVNGDIDERVRNSVHNMYYMRYALIIARLANNPNFEELALNLGAYGPDSGKSWGRFGYADVAVAWPRLVNYLRENIKPLSDWPKHFVLPPYTQENELQVLTLNDQKNFPTTTTQFHEVFNKTVEELLIESNFIIVEKLDSSDRFSATYEKKSITVSSFWQ